MSLYVLLVSCLTEALEKYIYIIIYIYVAKDLCVCLADSRQSRSHHQRYPEDCMNLLVSIAGSRFY